MSEDKHFRNLLTYDAASPLNLKNLYIPPFLKDLKDNQKLLTWFEQKTSQLIAEDNVSTNAFIKGVYLLFMECIERGGCVVCLFDVCKGGDCM